VLHEPRMVPRVRSAFEDGEIQFGDLFQIPSLTFESNVVFELRFMIDTEVKHKNLPSLLSFSWLFGGLTVDCGDELGRVEAGKVYCPGRIAKDFKLSD
jgi:hypothetical protein